MSRLINLFERILESPEGIIIERSVTRLWFFISGYRLAMAAEEDSEDTLYDGFSAWLAQRWEIFPVGLDAQKNWAQILLFATSSEYRAFNVLKELWYEYKAEMQKKDAV